MTSSIPPPWDTVVDWAVTIAIAVAAVLAIKTWVINPYRIPSSSMEPTLHCAQPEVGCQAGSSDRVLANRFIYHFRDPQAEEGFGSCHLTRRPANPRTSRIPLAFQSASAR